MVRVADPPREIPPGLRLKVLAHRDVTGSLFFFLPAAAALVGGAFRPEMSWRIGLFVVGLLFLLRGLKTALPALFQSVATLRRMRFGFVTMGRIVSCHLAWDGKPVEMPYAEFLADWPVNIGRSQMNKATGCMSTIVVTAIVVPFVLMLLSAAFALGVRFLALPGGEAMAGDLDGPYLAKWAAMGAGFIALVMLFLRFWRRGMADQVVPYMEWRRLMQPGANDVYDEHAQRLAALAKERGEQISLKAPLPENSSGIVLMCKVEYSVMGERRTSAGRAPLSNRLDPAGIERLIFHPAERKTIELFVGLPDEARIDAQGQWSSLPVLGPSVQLALTGATAAVAFAAFCWHVLAHIEMFR